MLKTYKLLISEIQLYFSKCMQKWNEKVNLLWQKTNRQAELFFFSPRN